MKKLAAEFQAKIRADTNAARGLSNASRGFGLDVDMFTSDIGPPTERTREDLLNRIMCILLGDEESHQPLVSFHANVFLKKSPKHIAKHIDVISVSGFAYSMNH